MSIRVRQRGAICAATVQYLSSMILGAEGVDVRRTWILVWGSAVGLVLFASSSVLQYFLQARHTADLWGWGFPFAYYEVWGPCPNPGTCQSLQPDLLAVDLLLWLGLGIAGAFVVDWMSGRRG